MWIEEIQALGQARNVVVRWSHAQYNKFTEEVLARDLLLIVEEKLPGCILSVRMP
jgi:hypothetical protein